MACDRPAGDCTQPSNCGSCADVDGTEVVLPKCQDIALVAGTFPRATVVVNSAGCITAVTAGEPEVYTPDDCCGGEAGGGTSTVPGPRGPAGDAGAGATATVDPTVLIGTTDGWSVQNVGTVTHAIFQFTAPKLPDPTATPTGITGNVGGAATGLVVNSGLVTSLPTSITLGVSTDKQGTYANDIVLTSTPLSLAEPNKRVITLNLDSFAQKLKLEIGDCCTALTARMDALDVTIAAMPATVYEVVAASGVQLRDAGGNVVVATRVTGTTNTWDFGIANAGKTLNTSNGIATVVATDGTSQLIPGVYPTGIA